MNGQAVVIALVLVSLIQLTSAFEFSDCAKGKNAIAKVTNISVSSCPDTSVDRCDFVKGTNVTMTLNFVPTSVFAEADISIKANIGITWVPFHLPGPTDACGNYGFNCPVKVGDNEQLKLSLPIFNLYPSIKTTVRFKLDNGKANPIVCFEFPVHVTSSA